MLRRPDRARSVGPIVSTVERQLLSQREPVSWDVDLATQLSDSILEPECPVVIASMNFENGGIERAKFVLQGAKDRRTPPSPFGSADLLQRLVVGLEQGVWGDQAMLGGEDEPAVTCAFDIPTTTPKERGCVEVASLSGPVELGLNAADKADPARVRHDEMSRVRRESQPRRPSNPLPSTPGPQRGYRPFHWPTKPDISERMGEDPGPARLFGRRSALASHRRLERASHKGGRTFP